MKASRAESKRLSSSASCWRAWSFGPCALVVEIDVRRLHRADDVADADLGRGAGEAHAAVAAAYGADETGARQEMHDLEGILRA